MIYKVVILDLDNTLIDFDQMEIGSLKESLTFLNIKPTQALIETYIRINHRFWQALEKGLYTKSEILVNRFKELFDQYNIQASPEAMNQLYLKNMSHHIVINEGALEILELLKDHAKVVCITNGVQSAQEAKFEKAGFYPYFDHVIISDVVGIHKPDRGIFDYMLKEIGHFEKSEMIIVGDSLTSDIRGGNNFGIKTIWFNPKKKINDENVHVDYEIDHLKSLKSILI